MAKKIPQDIAFRLAQKAKEAEKKAKEAEKKAKAAEKKTKAAEKKAKAAEKKAEEAEKKTEEAEDDIDDFDDFDDFEEDDSEEHSNAEPVEDEVKEQTEEPESSDSDLDELLQQASDSESSDLKIARANKLLSEGDFAGALEIWKGLTASESENPANWRGLASVLDVRDQAGDAAKAKTAREHADRIETQAIAAATGRNMEDIIADLLDDGELNFSAGSDAKETE